MNQYVNKDISFREIGTDGELLRINKVAIITKPPLSPFLSSLPAQYKLIPVHLRKFVSTPDNFFQKVLNFKNIDHINENDIEILKSTD